jgi:simple sugar transport system ATP-binding protein
MKQTLDTFDLSLPLDERVSDLSVGQQQRVEIAKALFHKSDVLILDEPTSVLTPIETEELFKTVAGLRRLEKAVVFITHRLREALRISDRISILKRGRKVAEFSGETLRRESEQTGYRRVFDVMFDGTRTPALAPVRKTLVQAPVLELDRIVCLGNRGETRLKNVSLTLNRGEIFGVAGVDGNGQKEMAEVIAGQRKMSSGRILLDGEDITHLQSPPLRTGLGISYITDDRMHEGCAMSMSVAENAVLRLFKRPPFSRRHILNKAAIDAYTRELIKDFNIKAGGPSVAAGTLSGGNIQKLLLARALSHQPKILICNKPTQGLDARTTRYVQERLQEESRRGAAVLLISLDLDELLGYSDRIGVLYNGELMDILDASSANQEHIGSLMLGIRQ